jgi:hypothetical protein
MIHYNVWMVWRGRSRRDLGLTADWRRQAVTFAALLAVFLQAFIIQTHIHVPAAIQFASGYEQSSAHAHDVSAHATSSDQKVMCMLCQVLSNAHTLLASPAILLAATQTNAASNIALALAPRALSHFWQSRAPPSFL